MTAPLCPACGGWGYVTDRDDRGEDVRIVPCWRGCEEADLPTAAQVEAIRAAERTAQEDFICRHISVPEAVDE